MENQEADIKAKIAELKQRYTRLALNCKAAGLRVNQDTVAEYLKEIKTLEISS